MAEQLIKHGKMLMKYTGAEGEAMRMYGMETVATQTDVGVKACSPNFILTTAEDGTGPMEGTGALTGHSEGAKCISFKATSKGLTAKYLVSRDRLEVTMKMEFIHGADVVRQVNTVKNISKEPVTVTHFGSALLTGVAAGGLRTWYRDDSKIKVHHCLSNWQGEAQWREDSLEHLGIYKKTAHGWDVAATRFRSVGSWSTGRQHPIAMVEDTETGVIWYVELECGYNWTIELGNRNGHAGDTGTFYLEANAADEETGFVKVLKPGKSFTAAPALFGCTDGGFEEAAKQLLIAKRKLSLAPWGEPYAPACFNTYMDCVWGAGDEKSLPPLIDKAAECGAEVFCLDAGWYIKGLGEWSVNDAKYGEGGLKGIFDYIRSKGMKPGAWLEIESLDKNSPMHKQGGLLTRNGYPVADGHFADFTVKEQCDYLEGIFDMLYNMGVRFIKNDYNLSVMFGSDANGAVSPAEGLKAHTEAFYAFIDRMKKKYPDLYVENCGSGAMRCDTGTLSHFSLQSTSDQEFYDRNPAIVSGMAGLMPPEKAGIWSYPYPVSFYENQTGKDIYADEARMAAMADGEQTVFNMINALCGTLYLSGRIDKADELNTALIKEGVDVFKKYRAHVASGYPVWPCGKLSMADRTHSALGFLSPDGKKMTLAVWKFEDMSDVIEIDLSKYFGGKKVDAVLAYPSKADTAYAYHNNTAKLSVKMPKDLTARFFELTVRA